MYFVFEGETYEAREPIEMLSIGQSTCQPSCEGCAFFMTGKGCEASGESEDTNCCKHKIIWVKVQE